MSVEIEELMRAASYQSTNIPGVEALVVEAYSAGQESAGTSTDLVRAASFAIGERASAGNETGQADIATSRAELRSETSQPETETPQIIKSPVSDAASVASEVNRLIEATQAVATEIPKLTSPRTSTSSTAPETSIVDTVLQTAKMVSGVGPIVTGLMKLFGSREAEPLPALEKFVMPAPVAVEAGLSSDRGYGAIRYTQDGRPQMSTSNSPEFSSSTGMRQTDQPAATSGPSIQVNIQAMDSQSFLDRQDDIARAVREAMLHSNSLNDVVMEL